MLQGLLAPLLPALWAAAAAAMPPPEHCESEMNKIKDLLQVSCVGQGLTSIPAGLPTDTGILLLGSNSLGQAATASFQHLQHLRELDLSNNSLAALETSAPLPRLQQLLLSHNGLGSPPALPGLPGLKGLALGHNSISQLPEGGFRDLGQLCNLELQSNRLQRLPGGAFQGLGELEILDLSENLLEALPRDLLAELSRLEILRLDGNRLQRVPVGFFSEDPPYVYVYLARNPWLCDCRLLYLRDWILENDIRIYTHKAVQEKGSEAVVTENEPESVQCHEPDEEKSRPVMHFQAACEKHEGIVDGEGPADDTSTLVPTVKPTAAAPPTTSPPAPPDLSSHSPSTSVTPAGASSTTTTSTATTHSRATSSPAPSAAIRVLTATPAVAPLSLSNTGVTAGRSTAPSTSALTAKLHPVSTVTRGSSATSLPAPSSETARAPSTPAATFSSTFAHRTTARLPPAPATHSTPPPAMTVTGPLPSTLALAPLATRVKSSPATPVSTPHSPPPPSSEPSAPCLCPALPVRVLGVAAHKGSPANRLAGYCCLLRLTLYVVCLGLVALPTLAVLCWLAWVYLSWYRPALQGAPGARLVRYQEWQKATPREWRPKTAEVPSAATGPRIYRVCKKFRIAPSRHVTWLLVSLPGSAREWPWEQKQDALSSYSLDRGRDTIGAVRVKYAAASL